MYRLMFKLVVTCLLVALAATGAYALKLEYKFKEGDVSRYKVKEKATGNQEPQLKNLNSDWDGILVLKVNKVLPNGDAEVTISYESGTLRMKDQSRKITPGELPPVVITVAKNGTIRNPEVLLANNRAASIGVKAKSADGGDSEDATAENVDVCTNIIRALWQVLPDKALNEGDKWKQDVPAPAMWGTTTAQCTLQKTNSSFNGIKAVSILMAIDENIGKLPDSDQPWGNIKENGVVLFSSGQGRVVSVKNTGQLKMSGFTEKEEDALTVMHDFTVNYSTEISLLPDSKK